MASETGEPTRVYRIVANALVVLTALWLLACLIPAGRTMRLDMVFSFLLGLLVTGLLWWAAARSIEPGCFWRWLAAAWTVALLGTTIWGVYDQVSGTPLPSISWVDGLYLVRYALVLVAFWRCLGMPSRDQWIQLVVALLLAAVGITIGVLLAVPTARLTIDPLALAVYPILDVGLIYIALETWRQQGAGGLRNALGLLLLALVAYGAANWLKFYGEAIPFDPASRLATFVWPLSDILTGTGVLHLLWVTSPTPAPQAESPGGDQAHS